MTPEQFYAIAARYVEIVSPGRWPELTDKQQAVHVRLIGDVTMAMIAEGFMPQRSRFGRIKFED